MMSHPMIRGVAERIEISNRAKTSILLSFVVASSFLAVEVQALEFPSSRSDRGDFRSAFDRSLSSLREARRLENSDLDTSVDAYYEAAVFADESLRRSSPGSWEVGRAVDVANIALRDCLRAASRFGRIDPSSQLIVNGPLGSMNVPISRRGFPWLDRDFGRLIDPRWSRANPEQRRSHRIEGLGATQVVERVNPNSSPGDAFLRPRSYFPATAILHPDRKLWLNGDASGPGDRLELIDPLRIRSIDYGDRRFRLAADPDASISLAEETFDSRNFILTGFLNPEVELSKARVVFLEPYQPGKIVVVIIHGLLDDPFTFTDMINSLRMRQGFCDRFQLAAAAYPTGNSFLRSASIIREQLRAAESVHDPDHVDPGFQNMVLVGYSMGGLVAKLQTTSSGRSLERAVFTKPLESLRTPPESRERLEAIFRFEPLSFVSRVIYIATPHDGSGVAAGLVGRLASRLVRPPSDSSAIFEQIRRDDPHALAPWVDRLPSSIDLLASGGPLLESIRMLPTRARTRFNSVVGEGYLPGMLARGDSIVSLSSAYAMESESELRVKAIHTNIFRHRDTIEEVARLLNLQAAEVDASATLPVSSIGESSESRLNSSISR
ncbi:MAG: hypothetical protein SFX72_02165 [Isosphaeraceae bacterium]|nr:hypothetical protein [Isosphaeraceae bacterium]